jgi:small subunit ribosomal protein S5
VSSGTRGKRRGERNKEEKSHSGEVVEKVVAIKRCSAVVKGGRRFSFAAMVVVGDGKGKVGWGYGKANEVPPSVEKAVKEGTRSMVEISLDEATIPHQVKGRYGAAQVVLVPASPGTGVIAGAAVRAVCDAAGIHDILTKSFGSNNPVTLVKATIAALQQLRPKFDVERLRGVTLS